MKTIEFVKMEGAGNDFIVIDNRRRSITGGSAAAKRLCARKFSVGGDGLVLLERSKKSDIRMRIFNPDGSEAEMCGNGVRCIAKFASERRITGSSLTIETMAGEIRASVKGDVIKARLMDPKELRINFRIPLGAGHETVHFVNTGVPHVVKVVDSIERVDVKGMGRAIRHHENFAPRGANVNFIEYGPGNSIRVATYERGVESETLACGTGSTASALIAAALKGLKSPVSVRTAGGETLKIYFSKKGDAYTEVCLEGRVRTAFEGRVKL